MAGIPMAELVMKAHGCQHAWLQHLVDYKEQALLQRYVDHCQRKMAKHIQQRHGGMAGLGYAPTRGAGIPGQYQRIESRPDWAGQLPAQSIAEGYGYAFPSTSSAFLERSARIYGGQGGVFTGQLQRGTPQRAMAAMPAYRQAMPQPSRWTNPWTSQQWFTSPQGMPIWGGGYTQPFRPTNVQGRPGGATLAVGNVAGQFPPVGSAIERF